MKVEPVSSLYNFLGSSSQLQENGAKVSNSFTGLLLQALLTGLEDIASGKGKQEQNATQAPSTPNASTPSSGMHFFFISISDEELQAFSKQATLPPTASAIPATPQMVESPPIATPKSGAPVAQPVASSASTSPPSDETSASSSSSLPTAMFPSSGALTHSGYMPALMADLVRNETSGEIELHFTPTTTINDMEWLHLLRKAPMPSLLGQIQREAKALGVSLDDTPLTLVDTDLPPPFAGKSLEELNRLVVPTGFYYSNPNGYYGSIGGQLPADASQRSNGFAAMKPYVIELPTSA